MFVAPGRSVSDLIGLLGALDELVNQQSIESSTGLGSYGRVGEVAADLCEQGASPKQADSRLDAP
jgi:hypothetical protein